MAITQNKSSGNQSVLQKTIVFIFCACLIYSVGWVLVGYAAKHILSGWQGDRIQLSTANIKLGGFPSELKLTLANTDVQVVEADNRIHFILPETTITISSIFPVTIAITSQRDFEYIIESGKNQVGNISALRIIANLAPGISTSLSTLDIQMEKIQLPDAIRVPYPAIDSLHLFATFTGSLPIRLNAEDLREWRDEGGLIEDIALSVYYGDLNFELDGTLSLDEQMNPELEANMITTGFMPFADALGRSGLYSKFEVIRFKDVANNILADHDGDSPVIRLPFSLEKGIAYAGELPVGRITNPF